MWPHDQMDGLSGQEFKTQLAFDRGLFQTNWFAVISTNPQLVLSQLDITFIYSDSVIVDVKIQTDCTY